MSALGHQNIYLIRGVIQRKHNSVPENLIFNKRSGEVVMSPDSERLGAAVEAAVGSNFTQPNGISYFILYTFSLKYLHQ